MSELSFRQVAPSELEPICEFYWAVCDAMQGVRESPRWTREVYPSRGDLQGYIGRGELFVAEHDGRLCGALAVSGEPDEGYADVAWPSGAAQGEVAVIHLLCVAPSARGHGYGRQLVGFAVHRARELGAKALRLDIVAQNRPARRLYESCGFAYVDTARLHYEDTGWMDFPLFELVLDDTRAR